MRGIITGKRIAAWLLTLVLTLGMLAGCGGRDDAGAGTEGGGTDSAAGDETAQGEAQGTAMGRYVEKETDLGGNTLTDWNGRVFQMADGSLLLSDNSGFVLRSRDNGASWSREELPWLTKMKGQQIHIHDGVRFGSDGGGHMDRA